MAVKRKPAANHLAVIDNLKEVLAEAEVSMAICAELIGMPYITFAKIMNKERNLNSLEVRNKMVAIADLLVFMLERDVLPIPQEMDKASRKREVLDKIRDFAEIYLSKPR